MFFLYILFLGAKCPDGWTQADASCYFLSTYYQPLVSDAVKFCEDLGSVLVEVSTVLMVHELCQIIIEQCC